VVAGFAVRSCSDETLETRLELVESAFQGALAAPCGDASEWRVRHAPATAAASPRFSRSKAVARTAIAPGEGGEDALKDWGVT
jgi:hypothetical protein